VDTASRSFPRDKEMQEEIQRLNRAVGGFASEMKACLLKISWQLVEKGPMRHDSVLRLR